MDAIATFLRLGLAACLSGAAAGLLFAVAVFCGRIGQSFDAWWTSTSTPLAALGSLAAFGVVTGLVVASPPAFVAGAAMWATGRGSRRPRSPLAWACAGAAVGALFLALLELAFWTPGRGFSMTYGEAGLLAVCLAAGAGGALVFRATMILTGFMEE